MADFAAPVLRFWPDRSVPLSKNFPGRTSTDKLRVLVLDLDEGCGSSEGGWGRSLRRPQPNGVCHTVHQDHAGRLVSMAVDLTVLQAHPALL